MIAGLVLSGIPAAYADDATVYNETELRAALNAPGDTHNITLGADITTTSGISILNKTINFILGEYDLNIVSDADDALNVNNGTVTINCTTGTLNVQGSKYGVLATNTSSVTVTNATATGSLPAVRAQFGSDIVVKGDVDAQGTAAGVSATQSGSSITVEGNITTANGIGAEAYDSAVIDIAGNVNAKNAHGLHSVNGVISVNGNVTTTGSPYRGASAFNGGRITVDGNVTGVSVGAYAENDGCLIEITGDVTATYDAGIGAAAFGVLDTSAQIIIGGIITAPIYVQVGGLDKNSGETVPTTKLGYNTYNKDGFTVWVKDAGGGISASPASLPSSGGDSVITLTGAHLPAGVHISVFDGSGNSVGIDGITTGDSLTQTVSLAFPANPSTTADAVYIVKALTDRINWDTMTATVTVAKATPSDPEPDPSDEADKPTVMTNSVSGVTATGATLSGNVVSSGGATVTERGFVYGKAANPVIGGAGVTKVVAGFGKGSFTSAVSGLEPGTDYHVRAYAINSEGTAYGADVAFRTADIGIPKTGDNSGFILPLVFCLSAAGIIGLGLFCRKKLYSR